MTTDLTDRYIWAVVRLLPEARRDDLDAELRSLVADMVDARLDTADPDQAPAEPDAIEREVLAELGDPDLMAARYAEPQRSLIGPELFPAYLRTLKVIGAIAVPVVALLSVLGRASDGSDDTNVGEVIGAAISGAYHAAIQVALWVTLFYAISGWRRRPADWTPDDLPDLPADRGTGPGVGELAFGVVVTILAGVALVGQHVRPLLRDDDGDGVPFLDPDLWGGAGQVLLALLAASLLVQGLVLAHHGWTMRTAVANAVVNAGSLGVVAWASFGGWLINDRFLALLAERGDWERVPTVNAWTPVLLIGAIEVWDTVDAFRHARRAEAARVGSTASA